MSLDTVPFDAAEYLNDPEALAEFLDGAFESNDPSYIAHALGVVARARGMTTMANEVGITREGLYKALSERGDPQLSTLVRVVKALGLRVTVQPAERELA
jgi:probable addiction module antidote protein